MSTRSTIAIEKRVEQEIKDYIEVPDRIKVLSSNATVDLYFGPVPRDEVYQGFESAIRELREWVDEVPCELWVDSDTGEIWKQEPESYEDDGETIEPFWDSIYHLQRKDILRALFNSELVKFLVY